MRLILLYIFLLFFSFVQAEKKSVCFSILTFNDVYDIHPKPSGIGGFAKMQSILKKERKKLKHHITTVNGDFLFPSVLSTFDKGKHRVELFNAMGVDLVVLGNHEFDFGPDVVQQRISESKFLWLGANVYDINGRYFTGEQQTLIKEVDGIKVGFFGVLTNETPLLSSCDNKVLFCPIVYTAKKMCKQLKQQGVDVIVALTHLFISEDRKLAKAVPEIDLILGGHDHDPVMWYEHGTSIAKMGQNAYFLGRIDLLIEKDQQVRVFPSWEMIVNKDYPEDEAIKSLVSKYDKSFEDIGLKPIAQTVSTLDSRHVIVRSKESTMANLILDALKEDLQADCALMSGGIIRGDRLYSPGTSLNYKDLMQEIAFDNVNILLEVSGYDLLKALENGVSNWEYLAGRFPQVSGMKIFFNENNKPGERIIEVYINGHLLKTDKLYKLATNTYNAKGGDGFYHLCNGRVLKEGGKLINTVVNYLKKNPKIDKKIEGRILSIEDIKSKV